MDKRKASRRDFNLMTPVRLGWTTLDVSPHTHAALKRKDFSYGKKNLIL